MDDLEFTTLNLRFFEDALNNLNSNDFLKKRSKFMAERIIYYR
jgi:hypothetical protein